MFFEQIEKLCKLSNISPTDFVENGLKMSRSNVTKWKEGKVPKSDTLQKIADYFNVTTDYLLGNEQKNKPSSEKDSLSEMQRELLDLFDLLTIEQQRSIVAMARSIAVERHSKDM